MDNFDILEREATLRAYVCETEERFSSMEGCLDDLRAKLTRVCQADLTDQKVMRGLLDQTRMVTSTIRGYDKLIEMRMNMEAHRQATQRQIEKLRWQQNHKEEKEKKATVQPSKPQATPHTHQSPQTQEKNNPGFTPEMLATLELLDAEEKARKEAEKEKNILRVTPEQKKFRNQLKSATAITKDIQGRM